MSNKKLRLLAACATVLACAISAPAYAQATRTWVSGVGDDANPCSRTAPCKTFAGAISKTAAGGEINCLDPGGFGGVTITKSISIVCDYTEGGILSAGAGVNGIVVNAGAADVVFLSGLDFNGAGSAQNGIRLIAGGLLTVRNSIIRNYRASNGLGISFAPTATSTLVINNSVIANNGTGATGGGILIQPNTSGTARVTLRDVRVQGNANNGIRIDSSVTTSGSVSVSIENSDISENTTGISSNGVGRPHVVMINGSQVTSNTGTGISSNGLTSSVLVGDTTITGNATGISTSGGAAIRSYGDNRLDANPNLNAPNDGTFTAPVLPKR